MIAEHGAWLALMSLPLFGPGFVWDVAVGGDPIGDWASIASGRVPPSLLTRPGAVGERATAWLSAARTIEPSRLLDAHLAAGVTVTVFGDDAHPTVAPRDPHVPAVLLWRGQGAAAGQARRPAVGVIGTRRATRLGADLAHELGRGLTAAGCAVVSGLALGIDAAAHRGCLAAADPLPIAVVATGLDIAYPRSNRALWHDILERGLVCSEYPLGTPPATWRFPARNRILVALSDAVIVVESHERGGSLITAGIAGDRGVPVFAVPGSIRSPASLGSNRLLADGCAPLLGVDDVLTEIGLTRPLELPFPAGGGGRPESAPDAATAHTGTAATVLDALGWVPRSLDELADACPQVGLGDLAVAVAELVGQGTICDRDGRLERLR